MNRFCGTKGPFIAFAVASVGLLIACSSTPKSSHPQAGWLSNMHRLSAAHLELMPLVANGQRFSDPNQRTYISGQLREMVEASDAIVKDSQAPNADPIIAFTSAEFASEVRQAYTAFERNDTQYSRFALNRSSSYCISCHTRADRGVKDFEMAWASELSALTSPQTVEFLLANRRYKSALDHAQQLATDAIAARKDPRAWIVAIERTLGMVVRVNKDAGQAESLVKKVGENKSAPYYVRRDAAEWLRDIRSWQKELRITQGRDKFRAAIRLVDRAQKAGPRNPASLILFLRASGMLHELLEKTNSSQYGETLLYAGIVADSLRDLNMGFLDQYYYESCIQHQPHSELAESCFARLESSVRYANPFLDLDPERGILLSARLEEFRKLAEVKDVIQEPRWIRRPWEYEFGDKQQPQ